VMMMYAVSTSETSVNLYQTTRRNIPEDTHLHLQSILTMIHCNQCKWISVPCPPLSKEQNVSETGSVFIFVLKHVDT
jgi:hypothetical protein